MILPSLRGFIGIFLLILKLISVAASWKSVAQAGVSTLSLPF